jgi:DNA invertase Pin-like site-specific DNA recombinase
MTPGKAAVWLRVSTGHQDTGNQVPDVEHFAAHHGYRIAERYVVRDSAWKSGGGPEYRKALKQALDDAYAGRFSVLIVWALDRIVRDDESGAEAALRSFRQFRQRGCAVVSVKESWLNGAPEVQDILIAFAGWMAGRESARRSERIKIGLAKRTLRASLPAASPAPGIRPRASGPATSHPGKAASGAPPTTPGPRHDHRLDPDTV